MAGGHHGNGITYGGLTLHTTKGWHSRVGKGMCAIMWFWILYRAKQDGAVLLGWRHPWDHAHGHGHTGDHSKAEHHWHFQVLQLSATGFILKATCKVCNLNHCSNGPYWLRSPYFFLRLTSQYGLRLFLLFDWLLEFAITWSLLLFIGRNCTQIWTKKLSQMHKDGLITVHQTSCIGGGFLLPPEALIHKQAIIINLCFSLFLNVLNV